MLIGNSFSASLPVSQIEQEWKPIFWPDDYVEEAHSMKVQDNLLSTEQLEQYARKTSEVRAIFKERAQ